MTDWLNPALKISETTKKKIYAMQSGRKQYFVMPDEVYDRKFLPLSGSTLSAKIRWNKAIINYLPELYKSGPRFDTVQDARKYIFDYTLKGTYGKYGGGRIFCNKPHPIGDYDDPWDAWCVESVGQNGFTFSKRTGEWNRKTLYAMHFGNPKKGINVMNLKSYFINSSGKIVARDVNYPKRK